MKLCGAMRSYEAQPQWWLVDSWGSVADGYTAMAGRHRIAMTTANGEAVPTCLIRQVSSRTCLFGLGVGCGPCRPAAHRSPFYMRTGFIYILYPDETNTATVTLTRL